MAAIIFDLDGTLVDSLADIQGAANRMLAEEQKAALDRSEALQFVGNGLPTFVERTMRARDMDMDAFQRIHDMMLAYYTETSVNLTKTYPGVHQALDDLQAAGFALGLCTNKPVDPAIHVLRALDLEKYFQVVLGGDSLPERKPHARPLLKVAEDLGAERFLFVGDSEVDADTAVNAKVDFALYTEGYRKSDVSEIPHRYPFDDYVKLAKIAQQWAAL